MELEVWNTFIRKIVTIRQWRCIMRDMNMFRCGDMVIINVAVCDKSLLSLMGRTFDGDGIRSLEYFHSIDNYNTTMAMYHA
jgi:hypothetical protein